MRFPEEKFSVIILANRGDANPTRKSFQIADILLKEKFIIEPEKVSEAYATMIRYASGQMYGQSVAFHGPGKAAVIDDVKNDLAHQRRNIRRDVLNAIAKVFRGEKRK